MQDQSFLKSKLNLYHADNHFSVIASMTSFLQRSYYCKRCRVGYMNKGFHSCKESCKCCKSSTQCQFQNWIPCRNCNRYFVSEECFHKHLMTGICHLMKRCSTCGYTTHKYNKHVCGEKYCSNCKKPQPMYHKCFIQQLKKTKD